MIEDLDAFLEDHGKACKIGAVDFLGIFDQPDIDISPAGHRQKSTMYALTVSSVIIRTCNVRYDVQLTVDGVAYKVRDCEQLDDGAFTQINLSKI